MADRDESLTFYRSPGYEVVGIVAKTPLGHLAMPKLPRDEFVTIELVSGAPFEPARYVSNLGHLVVGTDSHSMPPSLICQAKASASS